MSTYALLHNDAYAQLFYPSYRMNFVPIMAVSWYTIIFNPFTRYSYSLAYFWAIYFILIVLTSIISRLKCNSTMIIAYDFCNKFLTVFTRRCLFAIFRV